MAHWSLLGFQSGNMSSQSVISAARFTLVIPGHACSSSSWSLGTGCCLAKYQALMWCLSLRDIPVVA